MTQIVVAALYVAGLILVVIGAVGAWIRALKRHAVLTSLSEQLRVYHDDYQAVSRTVFADMFERAKGDDPEAAARLDDIEAKQQEIRERSERALDEAGVHPSGSPSQDTWIPVELQMELTILTGTLRSLKWPGLTAPAGGLCSTVASVWSLCL